MKNVYIDSLDKRSSISFFADKKELLYDYDQYQKFIKGCEHAVRKDDRYTAFIAELRSNGFNHCAVLGNIPTDDDKIKLEMHHGPIFTLFDVCDIVVRALFNRGEENITTYKVGDIVLTEHENFNIQVVMLSKTPHIGNHKSNVFINIKSSIGRVDKFIDKYSDGLQRSHRQHIKRYLDQCKKYKGSLDNGLFDVAESLTSFK